MAALLFLFLSLLLLWGILPTNAFVVVVPSLTHHNCKGVLLRWSKDEKGDDGQGGGPSYSDGFLLNFHNQDQANKQLVTNSLAVWNEELEREQARIIEWQDSFQRNDLADFTPPMSSGLNCLMVGGEGLGGENIKLPWEEEAEAQVTSLRVLETTTTTASKGDIVITTTSRSEDPGPPSMVTTQRVVPPQNRNNGNSGSSSIRVKDSTKAAAVYDCIIDQGLFDAVVGLQQQQQQQGHDNNIKNKDAIRDLLMEAATALREFGIYVLVLPTTSLTEQTRAILEECSQEAGLEWKFKLDGISDDRQVVSVARRFCNGAMPNVGRLSRYQP